MRNITIMLAAIVLTATVTFSGCAQLAGVIESASDKAADAVESYCDNFTVDQRQVFGDQVRQKAAPHSITVTCN